MLHEDLEDHIEDCSEVLIECGVCSKSIRRGRFEQHQEECGKEYCAKCREWINIKEFDGHEHARFCEGCTVKTKDKSECSGCEKTLCEDCLVFC
mmetsp:Transcript_8344/g.7407  ORF Transcript_8344/g.7407 Transcript_8344/m.7407 type:complete len:94 (+) Transcript_8344:530-811(+)